MQFTAFDHTISLVVTWAFAAMCLWGVINFWPRKVPDGTNSGASWLVLAIWLGFVMNGLNVVYWRGFRDLAVYMDWFTIEEIRWFGNTFGDTVWKGGAGLAVYLHFYARWKSISKEQQKSWSPLLMGFYPNRDHWFYRCSIRMNRLLACPVKRKKAKVRRKRKKK